MPYTILLSLDTVGASILNVNLYNCTGDTLGNVSGCTITGNTLTNYTLMSGYSNILKRDFPKHVIVPDGTYYIKAVPSNLNNGGCVICPEIEVDYDCIKPIRVQMPTTPTPTPTTTPTPVPTATPTNTNTPVPTNTPTPEPATVTPTPEPATVTPLPPTATPTALPPTATPTALPPTPTSTPYRIVANDLWVGDPGDIEYGDDTSCAHNSSINTVYDDGVSAWLYSATNICDATSLETNFSLGYDWVLDEMTPNEYIWISQTGITYDSTLGSYVRLFKRSGSTNTLLPSGTCINCLTISEPTPTPTPIPQITVNIYGRQNTPYDAVSNNVQLVYQTYYTSLGPVNHTTSGIQKSLVEQDTFLVSPSVSAGGYLNLGAFLRETDGACDYLEVNVNVFAAGAYLSSRFTDPTGSLLSDFGCGLEGSINGVSIPVSQTIDVYITPTSTGVCFGSALTPPGLECLTTNE